MRQALALFGAVLILVPFAANQLGRLASTAASYQLLNVMGSGILAAIALLERQWGFLLLEGTWVVVSVIGFARQRRQPLP